MGELIGTGIIAIVVVGGMIWLYVKANRSIKAQRGGMMKRSDEERNAIRESNYRIGGDGFSGGGGMA